MNKIKEAGNAFALILAALADEKNYDPGGDWKGDLPGPLYLAKYLTGAHDEIYVQYLNQIEDYLKAQTE